jgi:squalene-hopene/tetraprenyl-beta-curcumene cyclase
MRQVSFGLICCGVAEVMALAAVAATVGRPVDSTPWNARAAATYLDSRTSLWAHGGGSMAHGTFCVSCHTGLAYALARPTMRTRLSEAGDSSVEGELLASVKARVLSWNEIQPYLGDKGGGLPTESVLNALVLAGEDARSGHLTPTTREAFRLMWSLQSPDGSWRWINFGNEPWEADDSVYWGATLAAVATGIAPDGYRREPQIQEGLKRLAGYLEKGADGSSLFNRISVLISNAKLPGVLDAKQRSAILSDLKAAQRPDGGWSISGLILSGWKRRDGGAPVTASDGYATGLSAYSLEQSGTRGPELSRALAWLSRNQDPATGSWPTLSPNSSKEPGSDVGKFMTDAATAYAALALSSESGAKPLDLASRR